MLLATAATTLVAGALIGATGIGGVLLVPALTQIEGLPVRAAVTTSSFAFAFPGITALWWLRQSPSTDRSGLLPLAAGALPGAWLGGQGVHALEVAWLLSGIAALALFSGLRSLRPAATIAPGTAFEFGPVSMAALGLAVGTLSALTGTGGPVILIPLLMLLKFQLPRTVAAAQVIQLPVALSASAAHWTSGALDWTIALGAGALLMAGSLIGQRVARRVDVGVLQHVVALLLVATGLWLLLKLVPL